MEEQMKSYYGYLRFIALIMMLIIGNVFRMEISQFNVAFLNIYTAPIIAGAFVIVFWCFHISGTRLASFMKKRKLAVWPLVVTVIVMYVWSMIRFR